MAVPDEKMQEFLCRLDAAVLLAQRKLHAIQSSNGETWLIKSYVTLIEILLNFRNTASQDKLPRQSKNQTKKGAGMELGRGAGEWCEDDQMLNALLYVENYYRHVL
jgi:hypothetical protein